MIRHLSESVKNGWPLWGRRAFRWSRAFSTLRHPMSDPTPVTPLLPLEDQCFLLSDATRVAILRELARGEPLPVNEIARRLGRKPAMVSNHLATLRTYAVVQMVYDRFYRLAPVYAPAPGASGLEFGDFLLRLPPPPAG